MREQLLGYLLDTLDENERAAVERQLASDPAWRAELESLQTFFAAFAEHSKPIDPPTGLAARTCELVDESREATRSSPSVHRPTVADPVGSARARWGVADSVVMAGILLVASMLFFPAIANSRYAARIAACQNNLRQLGFALASYSDKAGAGYFPAIPSRGPRAFAGFYAPVLFDSGYLGETQLLICPGSPLARADSAFEFPTTAQVDQATPQQLRWIQRVAGGSYGYNLGVVVDGVHHAAKNLGRASFALMADSPPSTSTSDAVINNHLGTGRNVLYEDGQVRFLPVKMIEQTWPDHPFKNREGLPEAGVDANDAVVGPSAAPPFLDHAPPPMS
jgi:hypothetical protein